jgi:prepilin-type N-terminal cleavage/methylation domain-containing protein
MRGRESGFTLIELMVTVAVIAILASIALPNFFGEARRTRAFAEVQPMFNDLRIRLEQYMQENGRYPTGPGEARMHPAGEPTLTKVPIIPPVQADLPEEWAALKLQISGSDEVFCRYTWVAGQAGDIAGAGELVEALLPPPPGELPPPPPPDAFKIVVPATMDWYYLLAKCNMDGEAVPAAGEAGFSWYFASSVEPTIGRRNEGR